LQRKIREPDSKRVHEILQTLQTVKQNWLVISIPRAQCKLKRELLDQSRFQHHVYQICQTHIKLSLPVYSIINNSQENTVLQKIIPVVNAVLVLNEFVDEKVKF
jgi:hypothetical protein